MSVVDWHPDELADKCRAGNASAAEQRRIDEHLQGCAACRLEARLLEDFAAELADEDAVDGSLARLVRAAAESAVEPARKRSRAPAALAALVIVVAAGSAAALVAARSTVPLAEVAMKRASEAGADALRALDVPGRDRGQGPAPSESGSASPSAAPSESLPPLGSASPSGAAALFAAANQARRRGAHAEALRLYRELQRHHPSSPEAKLSHATMGKLMLDEGDSRAALDAFDRYLENEGGSLSEEALVGRALALQKLGRDAEERAAWQALLRAHPSSLHVPRARARLAELATE